MQIVPFPVVHIVPLFRVVSSFLFISIYIIQIVYRLEPGCSWANQFRLRLVRNFPTLGLNFFSWSEESKSGYSDSDISDHHRVLNFLLLIIWLTMINVSKWKNYSTHLVSRTLGWLSLLFVVVTTENKSRPV